MSKRPPTSLQIKVMTWLMDQGRTCRVEDIPDTVCWYKKATMDRMVNRGWLVVSDDNTVNPRYTMTQAGAEMFGPYASPSAPDGAPKDEPEWLERSRSANAVRDALVAARRLLPCLDRLPGSEDGERSDLHRASAKLREALDALPGNLDDVPSLQDEVIRLRRLDVEYGRVESAIIMADRDFDGDSDHANCGDRLIASVNRLRDRAENAENLLEGVASSLTSDSVNP